MITIGERRLYWENKTKRQVKLRIREEGVLVGNITVRNEEPRLRIEFTGDLSSNDWVLIKTVIGNMILAINS